MINIIYKYLIRIDTKITKFQPYEHPLTLDHEAVIFGWDLTPMCLDVTG